MKTVFLNETTPTYESENAVLLYGDACDILKSIVPKSIDLIVADPPYFLSNDGFSCSGGKQVSVNKGDWDRSPSLEEKHIFTQEWLRLCKTALKDSGSIWIFGTFHNIYDVGYALQQEGFKIINNITWQKTNPPPNLACRSFTHSTETIIWAKKDSPKAKHIFHYDEMKKENGGKQMKDVWTTSVTPKREKQYGKHPTQKPLSILERIIKASSNDGDIVLDPFCGSSTTGVAAILNGRNYIGIDISKEYLELSEKRLKGVISNESI